MGKGDVRWSKYLPFKLSLTFCNLLIQGPRASSAANLGSLLSLPNMYMCQHFVSVCTSGCDPDSHLICQRPMRLKHANGEIMFVVVGRNGAVMFQGCKFKLGCSVLVYSKSRI